MKKKFKYLFFIIFLMLFFCGKVNAKTYIIDTTNLTSNYFLNNTSQYNMKLNTEYTIGSNLLTNIRPAMEIYDPDKCTDLGCSTGLYKGNYLIDFYIITDGGFLVNKCSQLSHDFQNINMTTGNWVSNQVYGSCVDVSTGYIDGQASLHILYSFETLDYIQEFRFLVNYGHGFLTGNNYFKVLVGGVYDFDQSVITDFQNQKLENQQITQNQTIINQNTETNNKLDTQIQQNTEAETTRKGIWESLKTALSYINPLSENFFAYKLVELIVNALKALFIPEDMDFVTDFVDALESKLGFIAAVPVAIIEFIMDLANATWTEFKSIQLPSISIFGYNFWNAQEIDLTEAINIFKPFKYVTDVICVVICAHTLNKWRERFTGGGAGK